LRTSLAEAAIVQPSSLFTFRRFVFLSGGAAVAIAAACSDSSSSSSPAPTGDDGGVDAALADAAPLPDASTSETSTPPTTVTFSYRPSWKGVATVEVLGAFGTATDWTQAFATLVNDGTGTFKAVSPALASGHYLYIFRVTGDEAGPAGKTDKLVRYAIDPSLSAFAACPMASPTFAKDAPNPCSDLAVPQTAAAPTFHQKGVVQSAGVPIGGYLVEIERNETSSHHQFADRTTTAADGTFDLSVAAGTYRFQVLHPTYYAMTDAQRTSPETLAAVRRTISSSAVVSTDRVFNAAEVAFDSYAAMTPRGDTTLPTTFTFAVPAGTKARAAVYGPGPEIGDPWWTAPFGLGTTDDFDGGFNTDKAPEAGLKPDASYSWGTEETYAMPADGGGVSWTAQSMVFPVQFP
jgi:hypothetical protein